MGNNLPPLDPIDRRNAPWNESHPEPDGCCPHCNALYADPPHECERVIEVALGFDIVHTRCPDCGEVMRATGSDNREGYLESWRHYPEEMHGTIDDYSELKQFDE